MRKTILISAGCVLAAALLVLAYFIGKNNGAGKETVFNDVAVDENVTDEMEATVVKRVSQQMEAIAYQQKTISEMQRDRAEEQSRIAISMRDKAEKESQAARSAENKALQAAREAEESAIEAARQRDQATLAKRISDTLTYRTLGRTLASSSIYDYEDGQLDMAAAMAYSSWYFLDKYKGNVYLPECFQALSQSASSSIYTCLHARGAVKDMSMMQDGGCILVSDYGEIEYQAVPGKEGRVVLHNKEYNFRSVCVNGNQAFALSARGPVCVVDKDRLIRTIELPDGNYTGLSFAGDDLLFVWGNENAIWLNARNGRFVSMAMDLGCINSALYYNGNMHVFFADKRCAVMDSKGGITYETSPFDEAVTVSHYDAGSNCIYLGGKSGHVLRKNLTDGTSTVLYGHTSGILFISVFKDLAITGSYDKNVYIWNLPMIKDLDISKGKSSGEDNPDQSGSVANEWLIPASITTKAWPFSAIRLNDSEIIVGYSNGTVARHTVLASSLAAKVQAGIKHDLTVAEWQQYIGANVPYINFKQPLQ